VPLPELAQNGHYPPLSAVGEAAVKVVGSRSGIDGAANPIYGAYIEAIDNAKRRIWLTHSYFAPEPGLMRALTEAARRGVDVRLLLPGFSDVPLLHPVAQSSYQRLLDAGVKVYERSDAFVHAKTAVVDSHWTTIGSANLDYRSFLHNDEVNAMISDRALAERMEAMFLKDLRHAEQIRPESWRQRPLKQRFVEWLSLLAAYWL
jgi:cardiolipin synthase